MNSGKIPQHIAASVHIYSVVKPFQEESIVQLYNYTILDGTTASKCI